MLRHINAKHWSSARSCFSRLETAVSAVTIARYSSAVKNWINGQATDAVSGETIDKIDPRTGSKAGTIPRSSNEDVDLAVAAAKAAFPAWAATPAAERTQLLLQLAAVMQANVKLLAEAESADTGKPLSLSMSLDIPRAIDNYRFFAHSLTATTESSSMQTIPGTSTSVHITRRYPLGVVGLISPWNLPAYLLSWKIAPALAMGNTVVAKPSEMTPSTASLMAEMATEAGIPNGVLNIVHGLGPEAGQPILEHGDIKGISFTGGTATGRRVAATAAPLFKKVSLELGGKNPAVVFADTFRASESDKENTLQAVVRGAFLNSGQICLCGSRLIVESSIYDEFVHEFTKRVKALNVGHSSASDTDVGPVISEQHLEKISAIGTCESEVPEPNTLFS